MSGAQLFLALLLIAIHPMESACAMTPTSHSPIRCTVEHADKLPLQLGGEAKLCSAIAAAALPVLQRAAIASSAIAVSVIVKSESRLSATASVNGESLPMQNVAVSDRPLDAGAVDMLAKAVADEISDWATKQARTDR